MTSNARSTSFNLSSWYYSGVVFSSLTVLGMMAIMWAALIYALPATNLAGTEQVAQRIFYIHLGASFGALAGYLVSLIGSIAYLLTRNLHWDRVTQSSIEAGTLFGIALTATGAIWARPTWNTYWTWDPRLTTATITVLIYIAYMLFRNGIDNRTTKALFGSIYAVVASLSVPLTYYSARWFRSIHPIVWNGNNDDAQGSFDIGITMSHTLIIALISFSLLYTALMIQRMRQLQIEDTVAAIREDLS